MNINNLIEKVNFNTNQTAYIYLSASAYNTYKVGRSINPEKRIKDIPFIGYTDFHFEDKNTKEDFFIDLKTSKLLPQKISISHAMQQAIYQKATNAKQILWYLKTPTKTKDAEYIAMSLDDYVMPMKICEHIVEVMGNYLKTVNSPDDVKNSLIPNPDNWIWKEETVLNARKEVWGY